MVSIRSARGDSDTRLTAASKSLHTKWAWSGTVLKDEQSRDFHFLFVFHANWKSHFLQQLSIFNSTIKHYADWCQRACNQQVKGIFPHTKPGFMALCQRSPIKQNWLTKSQKLLKSGNDFQIIQLLFFLSAWVDRTYSSVVLSTKCIILGSGNDVCVLENQQRLPHTIAFIFPETEEVNQDVILVEIFYEGAATHPLFLSFSPSGLKLVLHISPSVSFNAYWGQVNQPQLYIWAHFVSKSKGQWKNAHLFFLTAPVLPNSSLKACAQHKAFIPSAHFKWMDL